MRQIVCPTITAMPAALAFTLARPAISRTMFKRSTHTKPCSNRHPGEESTRDATRPRRITFKAAKSLLSTGGLLPIGVASAQAPNAIALTGDPGWQSIPFAASNGNGSFKVTNDYVPNFPTWAAMPGVQVLTGDFNGDGVTDIALTGISGWGSIPVALSNGDGSFDVFNGGASNFAMWAAEPGAKAITGDFNCDGKTDIALVGVSGWETIPIAFSNGNGTFHVTNSFVPNFPEWAAIQGVKALEGPFNTLGCGSIALFGVPGWETIPVASSNGDGTFTVTDAAAPNFQTWASQPGVQMLTGYFTGNPLNPLPPNEPKFGIALVGVPGWLTIPVAAANGDGTFTVTDAGVPNFPEWAATPGVTAVTVAGEFSLTSIALVGAKGWASIPLASPNGDGTFTVTNPAVPNFPTWASTPGVKIVTGSFSSGFSTDIALVGGPNWASIPVAHFSGSAFTVTNDGVPTFPALAATPGVKALDLNEKPTLQGPPPK